jgi:hypothetical protein
MLTTTEDKYVCVSDTNVVVSEFGTMSAGLMHGRQ